MRPDVKGDVTCIEVIQLQKSVTHYLYKNLSSMEEQNFDSSKLHEFLKQNLVDFPKGDEELKIFKFRYETKLVTKRKTLIFPR